MMRRRSKTEILSLVPSFVTRLRLQRFKMPGCKFLKLETEEIEILSKRLEHNGPNKEFLSTVIKLLMAGATKPSQNKITTADTEIYVYEGCLASLERLFVVAVQKSRFSTKKTVVAVVPETLSEGMITAFEELIEWKWIDTDMYFVGTDLLFASDLAELFFKHENLFAEETKLTYCVPTMDTRLIVPENEAQRGEIEGNSKSDAEIKKLSLTLSEIVTFPNPFTMEQVHQFISSICTSSVYCQDRLVSGTVVVQFGPTKNGSLVPFTTDAEEQKRNEEKNKGLIPIASITKENIGTQKLQETVGYILAGEKGFYFFSPGL